ncbi:MAG: pyrroline-5-carboxylate reductase [bacterium]|jgi:pyrroline-5-carboxylate reductase|nr:pyrroline-5-carboxylate reductase [bacterium]
MLKQLKIGVIGVGKIGEALILGLLDAGTVKKDSIIGSVYHQERIRKLKKKLGITITRNNCQLVKQSDIVIIAVKPQVMDSVLNTIAGELNPSKLVISVAAAITTDFVERRIPEKIPVVRVMPNMPCLINAGMSVISPGKHANRHAISITREIFKAVGEVQTLEEKHMDAVTALSGSGPAYVYVIMESLAEAGVKVGMPRDISTRLAAQTLLGAAKMVLVTGEHPAKLKDEVTTPAGTTIDGILELEEGKLRVTLIKAVVKATQRSAELIKVLNLTNNKP